MKDCGYVFINPKSVKKAVEYKKIYFSKNIYLK